MSVVIQITPKASRSLKKIDKQFQNKIKEQINALKQYPNITKIKRLKNHDTSTHRLKLGVFHILINIFETKSEINI